MWEFKEKAIANQTRWVEQLPSSGRLLSCKDRDWIEKKKFQQVNEEKLNHYKGLINDTHSMSSSKKKKQKQLLEASLRLSQISNETQKFEQSLRKMENCVKISVQEIEELKTSVLKLDRLISTYKAPSVIEYIEKINELDSLTKQLKSVDRKKEALKISIKNYQQKYRKQLELNKNYPWIYLHTVNKRF